LLQLHSVAFDGRQAFRGNLNILIDARIHAPELISYQISVDPIGEKSLALLWSVEKFDADPSYHPTIVVSNLFRSVMQYMIGSSRFGF
jgi:hypothetical protein